MDDYFEELLAKRAKTLATIQHLLNYTQALIQLIQIELEEQQLKEQNHNKDAIPMCGCCKQDHTSVYY